MRAPAWMRLERYRGHSYILKIQVGKGFDKIMRKCMKTSVCTGSRSDLALTDLNKRGY